MWTLFAAVMWCFDKKLSYRRGTARCAVSVNTMLNVAKNIRRIACERSALCEWSSRFFKVIGMACSNMCLSCVYFFDTATFMVYVTDCRAPTLEKSFIFEKQLRLRTIDTFPFMYTHSVVNKCHQVTFKVTQGYRYSCHSIGHLWFPNSAPL